MDSEGDFEVDGSLWIITILHDGTLNVHIHGIKISTKYRADLCLEVNGKSERSYTENTKKVFKY